MGKMTSNFRNSVVSQESFEVLPGEPKWTKVLCSRTTGDHVDVYIYTSDGKKLRSTPDLLDYIAEHSQYWQQFDPKLINFERNKKESFGWGTKKIINFLESVRHAAKQPRPTRPKETNSFRRKDYSLKPAVKRRIGPKCVMKRWAQEGKINRKVLKVLEEHFCSSKIKPQKDQMMEWANELKITFEDVKDCFQMMWEGKLEYEWLKSVQKEESGTHNLGRGRPIKFFEPAVEMVVKDYYFNLDSEDDVEIVNENGEEEYLSD